MKTTKGVIKKSNSSNGRCALLVINIGICVLTGVAHAESDWTRMLGETSGVERALPEPALVTPSNSSGVLTMVAESLEASQVGKLDAARSVNMAGQPASETAILSLRAQVEEAVVRMSGPSGNEGGVPQAFLSSEPIMIIGEFSGGDAAVSGGGPVAVPEPVAAVPYHE